MSSRIALGIGLALTLAAPALAQNGHVATRPYVEHEIVSLVGRADYESTVLFGEGERIENVAVGQSGAWQVTPNKRANLLFIKPTVATAASTNMTVVTDRHTYLFELTASARATPIYLLRFAYPDAPAPAAAKEPEVPQAGVTLAASPALRPDTLNFAWSMTGARGLLPERCFDDGSSVYLAWPAGKALPAVLSLGPDGKTEGPVNYTTSGDYLVIEGFHQRLILRSGKEMASLQTRRASPAPSPVPVAVAAKTE